MFGYSSFESYDLIITRLINISNYIKEQFLGYFFPEVLETRKYLIRVKEISTQIDNSNLSESMKSRLKNNLISKFNSSTLNWNISSSEDIHNLIELSKDKHWYDMFRSPYFYIPFITSTFVTGCYFFNFYF
jgi:hypothetical protein